MSKLIKKIIKKTFRRFKKPINIRSSWIEEPTKFKSMLDFLNWFDSAPSIAEAIQRAQKDWDERLMHFSGFSDLNKAICLEIGFGGGRLLVPASRHFKKVIGVDVHSAFDEAKVFLASQNVSNYYLIHRDEMEALKAASIDFIFSFIVIQHFDSFDEVDYYLKHIKRILNPRGCCHIFFGKSHKKDIKVVGEKDFQKRARSLFIKPEYFRQHLCKMGFTIINFEDRLKKRLNQPLSSTNESGQARILFCK